MFTINVTAVTLMWWLLHARTQRLIQFSDIWDHINGRLVYEIRGNQAIIDLDICMATTHVNLNKHTLQLFSFYTFQLWTSFSFFFFFLFPFPLVFLQVLKNHATCFPKFTANSRFNMSFEIFLCTITEKNDRKERYT